MDIIARNDGVDRTVVRNAAYRKSSVFIRERHNERKNDVYSNPDVMLEHSHNNVHFRRCDDSYMQAFDKLCTDGVISTHGLKPDAKVIDEMIFDVNTAYFDKHGGYEYAKEFFSHAYDLAIKEAGGEQYILSAVMHADERNRSLSEELGRDIFHYHLHVIYVPVVEKQLRWSKRCKDKSLVGMVKATIMQVSHSKKWSSERAVDEHGNPILRADGKMALVSSYSRLQDRFFSHMREAGYTDIERGESRSGEHNLSVAAFKAKQEMKKAATLEKENERTEEKLQATQLKLKTAENQYITFGEIDSMGRRTLLGKTELTVKESQTLKTLAKECIISRGKVQDLEQMLNDISVRYQQLRDRYDRMVDATRDYFQAIKLAPQRVKDVFTEIFTKARREREAKQHERTLHRRSTKECDEQER